MSSPTNPPLQPGAAARTVRTLVLAFAGTLVMLTVVSTILLPLDEADAPPPLALAAFLLAPLLALLVIEAIGYRAAPLDAGSADGGLERVQTQAVARFMPGQMLRLALAEAPLLALLALSFVLPYGPWPLLVALVPGIAVLLFVAWPTRRNVQRVADALEAEGTRSYLPEAFGHA